MKIQLDRDVARRLQKVCSLLHLEGQTDDAANSLLSDLLQQMDEQPELLSWLAELVVYKNESSARAGATNALWLVSRGGVDFESCNPQHVDIEWEGGAARLHALDIPWENVTAPNHRLG